MNIFSWKCRGTTNKGFVSLMRDLRNSYDSKVIVLMETHTSAVRAASIVKKLGLDGSFVQDACGQPGGI